MQCISNRAKHLALERNRLVGKVYCLFIAAFSHVAYISRLGKDKR